MTDGVRNAADAVWLNGRLVLSQGAIAANDRGLLLGDGVFDTALVLGGKVFRHEAHRDRLLRAAKTLAIPVEPDAVEAAMAALAARRIDGSMRLTLTRGAGPRGIAPPAEPHPTLFGTTAPLSAGVMFRPVACVRAAIARNETSPTSRLKTLAYLDAILANADARGEGAEEALFCNTRGTLACSALANIFLLRGDELATPPLEDGVLDGVSRGLVLRSASACGLTPTIRSIDPDELEEGEAYLTNSLRLIAPVALPAGASTPSRSRMPRSTDPRMLQLMTRFCATIDGECGVDPRDRGAVLPAS